MADYGHWIRTERQPYDYGIDNQDDFMLNYRYTLVNVIEVEQAIDWLTSNNVLDKTDKEKILFGYKTSVLKAGDLIDAVLRRGPRGFNVLMEFIEYEYPEICEKMIGRPSREPDPDVYIPTERRSKHVSQSFKSGIELILKALEDTKVARNHAQRSIKELQEKIEDIEKEVDMKHEQILELSQNVLQLETHNKKLVGQIEQVQRERAEAVKQQETLRQERDQCREKGQEKLLANICLVIKQYSKNNPQTHPRINSKVYKVRSSDEDQLKTIPDEDELKKCKTIVSQLENTNEELRRDNRCLEEQFDKVAEQFDLFESSMSRYNEEEKMIKRERDKALRDFEELKEKNQLLQKENSDLKKTIMSYESKLRIFKNENSVTRACFKKYQVSANPNVNASDPARRIQDLEKHFQSLYGYEK